LTVLKKDGVMARGVKTVIIHANSPTRPKAKPSPNQQMGERHAQHLEKIRAPKGPDL